jgi:membrane peptidoglycan carboxypeptidase
MGQGDVLVTPLQLANYTAAIANKGWYYTPHIVKSIDGKPNPDPRFKNKHLTKSSQIQHSLQRILRQPREIWVTKLADRIANLQQSIFLHDNKWGVDYKEYYRDESILIN